MTPLAKYGMAEDMVAFDSWATWSACWINAGALFGVALAGGGRNGWVPEGGLPEGEVNGVVVGEMNEGFAAELALSAGHVHVLVELSNDGAVVPWGSQNCRAQGLMQSQVASTCKAANMPVMLQGTE